MKCAMDYSEKCFHMAEKIESINLMALNADQICMVNWIAGNFPKAVDTSRRALQLIEGHHREKNLILGGINMYSQFCGWCGTSLGFLGEFHEGKEILDKGLKIAQEIGDKYGVGWVEFMYSCVFYMEGDGSNTIRHALNAIQQFEESGADILMGLSWIMHGFGNHQLGDYNTAIDHAEKGLKLQKKVGAPFLTAWAYDHLAGIQLAAGNLIRAKECAEEALKSAGESKAKPCEGVGLIILGNIKGKEDPGHIDEAHQNIHGGIAMLEELEARPIYAQGYIFLGELLADVGRKEEALENLKKAESLYLEIKVTPKSYWLKRTQEALAKLG